MKARKTNRPRRFSTPMVQAVLALRKTQHRIILKTNANCPIGKVGDTLWVKETYCLDGEKVLYRADFDDDTAMKWKWKSSLFMPRDKSRINLKITAVRIERLKSISEEDAIAEGVLVNEDDVDSFPLPECLWTYKNYLEGEDEYCFGTAKASFWSLWESIHGEGSWSKNPYVWVIDFDRI